MNLTKKQAETLDRGLAFWELCYPEFIPLWTELKFEQFARENGEAE